MAFAAANVALLYRLLRRIQEAEGGARSEWDHAVLALVFGFVNAFIRPIMKVLTFPLIVLTLGIAFWMLWRGERVRALQQQLVTVK